MDTSEAPGTSTTSTSAEAAERLKQGLQALAAGKRHLLTKDVQMALAALEEGCKILDETRGTFSKESGEAHFYYGKALLEQSRIENGLFEGGAAVGVIGPEDYEEDVSDEEDDDEDDGEDEEAPELVAAPDQQLQNGNGTKKEVESGNGVASNSKPDNGQTDDAEPAGTEDEDQENTPPKSPALSTASSNSSPNTLELAWEVLEVSKLAFTRQLETITTQEEVDNVKKRLADVHLVLGEVQTESEQYPQAIQDFETAIGLLESVNYVGAKREVSQCLFQKGLALVFAKRFADGIAAFKRAKELIEARIAELPANSEEVAELQNLLPELEEKIADTEETEKDEQVQDEKMADADGEEAPVVVAQVPVEAAANGNGNGTSEKPVNDISHLVRRKAPAPAATAEAEEQQQKRKLDEEEVVDGVVPPPEKKQCTE